MNRHQVAANIEHLMMNLMLCPDTIPNMFLPEGIRTFPILSKKKNVEYHENTLTEKKESLTLWSTICMRNLTLLKKPERLLIWTGD
jgi:hypothetical protein